MEGGSPDQSFNFRYCKMTSPLYESLARLLTEQRNPSTMDLDMLSVTEVLRRINAEDKLVPLAVEREIPYIARAVPVIFSACCK